MRLIGLLIILELGAGCSDIFDTAKKLTPKVATCQPRRVVKFNCWQDGTCQKWACDITLDSGVTARVCDGHKLETIEACQ